MISSQHSDLIWSLVLTAQAHRDPRLYKPHLLSKGNDAPANVIVHVGSWAYTALFAIEKLHFWQETVCWPASLSMCLSAGMNMSPVSRLKKTWGKIKSAKFDILEVCISSCWVWCCLFCLQQWVGVTHWTCRGCSADMALIILSVRPWLLSLWLMHARCSNPLTIWTPYFANFSPKWARIVAFVSSFFWSTAFLPLSGCANVYKAF